MRSKKFTNILANIMVAIITILAWYAGFIVMQIVYDSIVASIIFASVLAVIVCCESRFSYITLKSDGKISISKEEVKSNLWQIVAATAMALIVSVPILLELFKGEILLQSCGAANNLGLQLHALADIFLSHWVSITIVCLAMIAIYNTPAILKMMTKE